MHSKFLRVVKISYFEYNMEGLSKGFQTGHKSHLDVIIFSELSSPLHDRFFRFQYIFLLVIVYVLSIL